MTLRISQVVQHLQQLQEANGDLELRIADWEFIKSREIINHTEIQVIKSPDSRNAMDCDELHDDCYPYLLIGALV